MVYDWVFNAQGLMAEVVLTDRTSMVMTADPGGEYAASFVSEILSPLPEAIEADPEHPARDDLDWLLGSS